ncbi:MAG: YggT family protein [Polyangiaceae bacterium]
MGILAFGFDAYTLVVLVAVICSWLRLSDDHPVLRFTSALTEPVLEPVRRLLPSMGGIDISPMVLLLVLGLVRRFVFA